MVKGDMAARDLQRMNVQIAHNGNLARKKLLALACREELPGPRRRKIRTPFLKEKDDNDECKVKVVTLWLFENKLMK